MNWNQLQTSWRVQSHTPTKPELNQLRAVIHRDLQDAALPGLSDDRRFATAYNAVLQLSTAVIACSGYRVTARQGHHQVSFQVVELAMGPSVSNIARYFDTCRRKRNIVDYDRAYTITETETQELTQKAEEFRQLVEAWIVRHHPQFAP